MFLLFLNLLAASVSANLPFQDSKAALSAFLERKPNENDVAEAIKLAADFPDLRRQLASHVLERVPNLNWERIELSRLEQYMGQLVGYLGKFGFEDELAQEFLDALAGIDMESSCRQLLIANQILKLFPALGEKVGEVLLKRLKEIYENATTREAVYKAGKDFAPDFYGGYVERVGPFVKRNIPTLAKSFADVLFLAFERAMDYLAPSVQSLQALQNVFGKQILLLDSSQMSKLLSLIADTNSTYLRFQRKWLQMPLMRMFKDMIIFKKESVALVEAESFIGRLSSFEDTDYAYSIVKQLDLLDSLDKKQLLDELVSNSAGSEFIVNMLQVDDTNKEKMGWSRSADILYNELVQHKRSLDVEMNVTPPAPVGPEKSAGTISTVVPKNEA